MSRHPGGGGGRGSSSRVEELELHRALVREAVEVLPADEAGEFRPRHQGGAHLGKGFDAVGLRRLQLRQQRRPGYHVTIGIVGMGQQT